MTKVLFITVGGSSQPVVTAIKTVKSDRVVFICSSHKKGKGSVDQVTGEGKPCEIRKGDVVEKLPNIPTQAEIRDKFDPNRDVILIDDPDDLSECYTKITEGLERVRAENREANIFADYTCGTKTMSAALVVASLDYEVELMITTNTARTNTIKVEGEERTKKARTIGMSVKRLLKQHIDRYLREFNYSAAVNYLTQLIANYQLNEQRIDMYIDLCRAFDLWDIFDHNGAWQRLKPYMKGFRDYGLFLKKVMFSRNLLDPDFKSDDRMKGHGYEVLQDLLLNAERRKVQRRYDDAVGRLYRSLELLAQLRLLLQYDLKTGNIETSKLPESLQSKYDELRSTDGKVQLGLQRAYELLSELNDPLGSVYDQYRGKIKDALATRNYSLMAHGFSPITEERYKEFAACVIAFIQEGLGVCVDSKLQEAPQFISDLSTLDNLLLNL
ncbi:MAG: TIGR02710 family CRISPR-associated CARF protein [Pseudanabaenaceae cyanobacterium]